jgi:hypothetical protein
VTGIAHWYSDPDLAILCSEPLAPEVVEARKHAFSESNLPILVDVAYEHDLPEGMRNMIEQEYEVIRRKTASTSEGTMGFGITPS